MGSSVEIGTKPAAFVDKIFVSDIVVYVEVGFEVGLMVVFLEVVG